MEIFSKSKAYDFMGKKYIFLSISILLIIASLISIYIKGFNLGIDFAGGVEVQVRFNKKVDIEEVRKHILKNFDNANITTFGSNKEFLIRLNLKNTPSNLQDSIGSKIKKLLMPLDNVEIRRVDIVGAKVGSELREKGLKALLFAMVGILIYVSFRFEWRFALAAILALFHDIIISLGAVSFARIEVNLDVLAAVLTIMGYSLNDTIVVFDRIREKLQTTSNKDLNQIINEAVSSTLSRTILTSMTTFFVVLTLYLFGGEIIKPFSFTLLIGIIVGTYSSIFIAASMLIWLRFKVDDFRKKLREKEKIKQEKERLRKMYEGGVV